MDIDRQTSLRLSAAGFVCALMVVLIHCQSMRMWLAGEVFDFGFFGGQAASFDAGIRFFLSYTFVRLAVPFFFVLTGFFLARSEKSWLTNVKKRFFTLYIPFVLWNLLNVILNVLAGKSVIGGVLELSERVLGWNPMVRLGCMQFWYLQAVFVFLIAWPLVRIVLERWWSAALLLSVLFMGWIDLYRYDFGHAMQASNFLWMSCGAVVAVICRKEPLVFRKIASHSLFRIAVMICFVVSVAIKIYAGVVRETVVFDIADKVLIASGLAALVMNLHVFDPMVKRFQTVLGLSFFIYAFHTIAITIAIRIGTRLGVHGLVLYLFKGGFGITVSIAIGLIVRRYFPHVFHIMTGGRK